MKQQVNEVDRNILWLLCEGYSQKETAHRINLSPRTVNNRMDFLKRRFKAGTTVHLVMILLKEGVIEINRNNHNLPANTAMQVRIIMTDDLQENINNLLTVFKKNIL